MKPQRTNSLLIVACSLFLCSVSLAAPTSRSLDLLMDVSGITKQIGEYPDLVKTGLMQGVQQGGAIPDSALVAILESADRTIQPSLIVGDIRAALEQSLSSADVEDLLQWYESDIGREITLAEEEASTAEAYLDMVENTQQLLGNTKRVEAAKRLDKLLGATDMSLDIQKFASTAIYAAMITAMAPEVPLDLDAFTAQMAAAEPQMRAQIEEQVIVSFVYTYLSLDDNTLTTYEAFLAKPATGRFSDAVSQGLNSGFSKVIFNWSQDIADIMAQGMGKQSHTDV